MQSRSWSVVSMVAFLIASTFAAVTAPLQAEAQAAQFDLPAQPLSTSLHTIADKLNTNILFDPEQVKNFWAPAIKGSVTIEQALTKVLAGTKLKYEYMDERTISLMPATKTTLNTGNAGEGLLRVAQNTGTDSPQGNPATNPDKDSADRKKEVEEVVVTGTHIRGGAGAVGSPIRTVTREEIDRSGHITLEQVIQSLPQNFRGGATEDSTFQPGTAAGLNYSGGTGVNLRGLGATATLVLVNGHRVASSGQGFYTDISTIPVSAVDHIDVLSDGASAIYGSEAIAGVVNIVLKKSSDGLDAMARYGQAAGGYDAYSGGAQVGHRWGGGGVTLGGNWSKQEALDASQRSFTSTVRSPTTILSPSEQTALTLAAYQDVGEKLELRGDAQYSRKEFNPSMAVYSQSQPATADRWSGAVGGAYRISNDWSAHYDLSSGRENVHREVYNDFLASGAPRSFQADNRIKSRFTDHQLGASGSVFKLPAGDMKLAAGVAHRTEGFDYDLRSISGSRTVRTAARDVDSAYAEVQVPILHGLTLSLAGRGDDYSDFGRATNPRYGISWSPVESLELRGTYSTSFRAPGTGIELAQAGITNAFLRNFIGPDGVTQIPVLQISGGKPNLQPETSTNKTVGFVWKPGSVEGLELSMDYYRISFADQIASPVVVPNVTYAPHASIIHTGPNSEVQALVAAARASGGYFDLTGGALGPNALANTTYIYDVRTANLSRTETSGIDLGARYAFAVGSHRFETQLNGTYIEKLDSQLVPGAPLASQIDRVGLPARSRVRALGTWFAPQSLSVSLGLNYTNDYPDTSSTSGRSVASLTTVDLSAQYQIAGWCVARLSATNLFDRDPPYVNSGNLVSFFQNRVHYDPANADPRGRFVNAQIEFHW